MLDTNWFGQVLKTYGFDFFTGVPCSFLKPLLNYAISREQYISAANEGDAVAIAAGAFLGGRRSVVLMQNSGLTNAMSPLTSLNYTFRIPVLGFVSLRGEEGLGDEPQHELMGKITTRLLDTMEIPWQFLAGDQDAAAKQLEQAIRYLDSGQPFFFVVRKGTFSKIELQAQPMRVRTVSPPPHQAGPADGGYPARYEILQGFVDTVGGQAAVFASTGYTGRELYQARDAVNHFYMVGSMGCAASLGLGFALVQTKLKTIVLDGDGALLMRMGSMATNGYYRPDNLLHILFDNHCHLSTGGQYTVAPNVDFAGVARSCGYVESFAAPAISDFLAYLKQWLREPTLAFIHLRVSNAIAGNLGRPKIKPHEVASRFMRYAQHG